MRLRALHRKAFRDVWHLRGQALAIALVIAAGIANLVMSQLCYRSLEETRGHFYADYAFADAWANAKRAPESVAARVGEIEGVELAESRLVSAASLQVAGFDDPIRALVVSIPDEGEPALNRLYMRRGRAPAPGARDEVLVSESVSLAHGLGPGDRLRATIAGRAQSFTIAGIAISPEYVYQIQPGSAFPDFKRFAILWTGRRNLEAALDMKGAWNNLAIRLRPGADEASVLARVDELTARYGGRGSHGREDQLSNRFLIEELAALRSMARIFPTIFLSVAAFLLNVVLGRLVGTQRDQVAILKAFGYRNRTIALHYVTIVGLIGAVGTLFGIAGGVRLGRWLGGIYQEFYRFPFLDFEIRPDVVLLGVVVSMSAAFLGTIQAVMQAARLPPAEAMRPPAPETYRRTVLERIGFARFLSQPTRMIARHLERRPWKSLLSVLGLALACAIMMVGRFQKNAVDYMVDVQYRIGQRNDVSVDFTEPAARKTAWELRALPGVSLVEPYRTVAVRIHAENRSRRTVIQGLLPEGSLKSPVDTELRRIPIPEDGVVLTGHLARNLGVRPGDVLDVEVLEGRQKRVRIPLVALADEYIGVQGYMSLDALNRRLGDGDVVSGAYLSVDPEQQVALYRKLEARPRVAGIGIRKQAVRNFYETMAESMLVFTFVSLVLGGVINFGVVYNSARIALSERGRELASLRVLGFTRGEVSYILLGELALLVLLSVPLGFLAGWALCTFMAAGLQSDLYRIPVHITGKTYAFAALTMAVSTFLSGLIVRRRIATLDLIAVLKTRE